MGFDFKDKLFIITGSAGGLGRGFAEAVLKQGAKVTISDILEYDGKQTAKELGVKYGKERVTFVMCDVTKEQQFRDLWDSAERHFAAPVDVLVNNAGINHLPGWKKCMDINITGVMIGAHIAFEKMGKKQGNGRGGLVVNTASMAAFVEAHNFEMTAYAVSKHGVYGMTKSMGRKDIFQEEGIKVQCICPFFANTKIISADKNVYNEVVSYLGERNIMSADYVAKAFIQLLNDGYNGAAICVFPHAIPFYWPQVEWGIIGWLYIASFLLEKTGKVDSLKPWMIFVFFIMTIMILYHLIWMVIGWVF